MNPISWLIAWHVLALLVVAIALALVARTSYRLGHLHATRKCERHIEWWAKMCDTYATQSNAKSSHIEELLQKMKRMENAK